MGDAAHRRLLPFELVFTFTVSKNSPLTHRLLPGNELRVMRVQRRFCGSLA